MDNKDLVLLTAKQSGQGPGGDVTAAAVLAAMLQMSSSQETAALAAIGGEPKKLLVTLSGSNPISSDKTFNEIFSALNSGKIVEAVYSDVKAYPVFFDPSSAVFAVLSGTGGTLTVTLYTIDDQDDVTVTMLSPSMPPSTVTVSGSTPTITPADNTIYKCGELTSLTISNPPATGSYIIIFISGATPTVLTVPSELIMPDNFAVEANTRYEINVQDGYALCAGWVVST